MAANEENLFKEEGYALMGAAFEVYNELGSGFLDQAYSITPPKILAAISADQRFNFIL